MRRIHLMSAFAAILTVFHGCSALPPQTSKEVKIETSAIAIPSEVSTKSASIDEDTAVQPIEEIQEIAQIEKPVDTKHAQARSAWDEGNLSSLKKACTAGNSEACKALTAAGMKSPAIAKTACDRENAYACEVAEVLLADFDRLDYVCDHDKAITGQIACRAVEKARIAERRKLDLSYQIQAAEEKRAERARAAAEAKQQRLLTMCSSRHPKACEELANEAFAKQDIDGTIAYANEACSYGSKSACDFRNVILQDRYRSQQAEQQMELQRENNRQQEMQAQIARQQLLAQQAALIQQQSQLQQQKIQQAFSGFSRPQPAPQVKARCETRRFGNTIYTDCN